MELSSIQKRTSLIREEGYGSTLSFTTISEKTRCTWRLRVKPRTSFSNMRAKKIQPGRSCWIERGESPVLSRDRFTTDCMLPLVYKNTLKRSQTLNLGKWRFRVFSSASNCIISRVTESDSAAQNNTRRDLEVRV